MLSDRNRPDLIALIEGSCRVDCCCRESLWDGHVHQHTRDRHRVRHRETVCVGVEVRGDDNRHACGGCDETNGEDEGVTKREEEHNENDICFLNFITDTNTAYVNKHKYKINNNLRKKINILCIYQR